MKEEFTNRVDVLNPYKKSAEGLPATLSAQDLPSNIKLLLNRFISAYDANACNDSRASQKLLEDIAISTLVKIVEKTKEVSLKSYILNLGGKVISVEYSSKGELTVYRLSYDMIEYLKTEIRLRLHDPNIQVFFEGDTLRVLETK